MFLVTAVYCESLMVIIQIFVLFCFFVFNPAADKKDDLKNERLLF